MQRGPPIGVPMTLTRTVSGNLQNAFCEDVFFKSTNKVWGTICIRALDSDECAATTGGTPTPMSLSFMQDGLQPRFEQTNPSVDSDCTLADENYVFAAFRVATPRRKNAC